MAKGELTRLKKRESWQRTREARDGKMALVATYEKLGLEVPQDLIERLQRQRIYLRNKIGDDDPD